MTSRVCTQADVAQMVEHITRNDGVTGSIPVVGSSTYFEEILYALRRELTWTLLRTLMYIGDSV